MPLVEITYKRFAEVELLPLVEWLQRRLPSLVAQYLSVQEREEAFLLAKDVELEFKPVGRFDTTSYALAVTIHANDYPERRSLVKRAEQVIWEQIVLAGFPALRHRPVCVWVRLEFGEFTNSFSEDSRYRLCPECDGVMEISRLQWMCRDCKTVLSPDLYHGG